MAITYLVITPMLIEKKLDEEWAVQWVKEKVDGQMEEQSFYGVLGMFAKVSKEL